MNQGISPAAVLAVTGSIVVLALYPWFRWLWARQQKRNEDIMAHNREHPSDIRGVQIRGIWWGWFAEGPAIPDLGLVMAVIDALISLRMSALTLDSRAVLFVLAAAQVGLFLWGRRRLRLEEDDVTSEPETGPMPADEPEPLRPPDPDPTLADLDDRTVHFIQFGRSSANQGRLSAKRPRATQSKWPGVIMTVVAVTLMAVAMAMLAHYRQPDPAWPRPGRILLGFGTYAAAGYTCLWIVDWLSLKLSDNGLPIRWIRWLLPTGAVDDDTDDDSGAQIVAYALAVYTLMPGVFGWLQWRHEPWAFHLALYQLQAGLLVLAFAILYVHYHLEGNRPNRYHFWGVYLLAIGALAFVNSVVDAVAYWIDHVSNHPAAATPSPQTPPAGSSGTNSGAVLLAIIIVVLSAIAWSKRPWKKKGK